VGDNINDCECNENEKLIKTENHFYLIKKKKAKISTWHVPFLQITKFQTKSTFQYSNSISFLHIVCKHRKLKKQQSISKVGPSNIFSFFHYCCPFQCLLLLCCCYATATAVKGDNIEAIFHFFFIFLFPNGTSLLTLTHKNTHTKRVRAAETVEDKI
jgi:hypothetical protein